MMSNAPSVANTKGKINKCTWSERSVIVNTKVSYYIRAIAYTYYIQCRVASDDIV